MSENNSYEVYQGRELGTSMVFFAEDTNAAILLTKNNDTYVKRNVKTQQEFNDLKESDFDGLLVPCLVNYNFFICVNCKKVMMARHSTQLVAVKDKNGWYAGLVCSSDCEEEKKASMDAAYAEHEGQAFDRDDQFD